MNNNLEQNEIYRVKPLLKPVNARVKLPGSKSYTNRALLVAALADGESILNGALFADDTVYMAKALSELGIKIISDQKSDRFIVQGCSGNIPNDTASLYISNAGTAARFLTAMLTLGQGVYRLDGNHRMKERPIKSLIDALNQLGAEIKSENNGYLPITVQANGLTGGSVILNGNISSQYFSALLMTGAYSKKGIEIKVNGELVSKPYLDMTKQLMESFGIPFKNDNYQRFFVESDQIYQPKTYQIEPDASAASYFFAAAAITGGRVVVLGLGKNSKQGDLQFIYILKQMGCVVNQTEFETEILGPEKLQGIEVNMGDISDTVQTLAAIAPFATSPTRIKGIGFIRNKETNRIKAMVTELNRLGVKAFEEEDGLLIEPSKPISTIVETYDDHRMAMSLALIGLKVGIEIKNHACVSKTFPNFFSILESLRR